MPKINLKPNSPEFFSSEEKEYFKKCEMPDCLHKAEHKAPRDRNLEEYYHFCYQHASEYNKAWNYFSGMSNEEVEEQVVNSFYGDRPTWRFDRPEDPTDFLRRKAWDTYGYSSHNFHKTSDENVNGETRESTLSAETQAMDIMGLSPPVNLEDIKQRYKQLAKKYHPDLNNGCSESEELLKRVNMAYTVLKLAYDKYEQMMKRYQG